MWSTNGRWRYPNLEKEKEKSLKQTKNNEAYETDELHFEESKCLEDEGKNEILSVQYNVW